MRFSYYARWLLFLPLVLALNAGCQSLKMRSQSPDSDELDDEFETTVQTPFVGDYTTIAGLNLVTLEGVGLVTGLDNTGGDPPISMYRTKIYNDMRRRGIQNPNQILRSPTTAVVIVRAYLPPLVKKGQRFDIEVRLPGNSDASSLRGGTLLETYVSEKAIVPGRGILDGHVLAKAKGPILVSTGEESSDEDSAGVERRGRIMGGGHSMTDRDMSIYLRNDFRSIRNSKRIADRVSRRFHSYSQYGIKELLAEAKTDQTIKLKILPRYKDNFPRYLQVVRNIAFRESQVAQRVRMQRLKKELSRPESAEHAAVQFEAIGKEGIPFLRSALKNSNLECRFHAAVALAYMDDPSGLSVLAEAARDNRALRVFAFAALSTLDEPETHLVLRDLMSVQIDDAGNTFESTETRYGAFRALWTMDRNDPFIHGKVLNRNYALHELNTDGPPMIHITHNKRAEIVLFGGNQEFQLPMALNAGNHILVTASPGRKTVTVSRFEVGQDDMRREVSPRVADVIRTCAEFGANYPDIAQMLLQAKKRHNAPGRIEIDQLPRAGRAIDRSNDGLAGSTRNARVGRPGLAPNMYSSMKKDSTLKRRETLDVMTPAAKPDSGTASLADAREFDDVDPDENKLTKFFRRFSLGRKDNQEETFATDSFEE